MALPGAYAQYNNSKVLTASPAELTLMLYDGAIKFCNIAEMAVEKSDVPKAHEKYPQGAEYHRISAFHTGYEVRSCQGFRQYL